MYELVINSIAEEVLTTLSLKNKKVFGRISKALDEWEEKGLKASNTKKLTSSEKIFRKCVGRWRILFTIEDKIINVWIVAMEKDTDKDYRKWIRYISGVWYYDFLGM